MNTDHNKTVSPELKQALSKIKHVALDMDGTIYLGSTLFCCFILNVINCY